MDTTDASVDITRSEISLAIGVFDDSCSISEGAKAEVSWNHGPQLRTEAGLLRLSFHPILAGLSHAQPLACLWCNNYVLNDYDYAHRSQSFYESDSFQALRSKMCWSVLAHRKAISTDRSVVCSNSWRLFHSTDAREKDCPLLNETWYRDCAKGGRHGLGS